MELFINNKKYTLTYSILSRLKMQKKYKEEEILELINNKNFSAMAFFIFNCIREEIKEEEFYNAYPLALETLQAFSELCKKIIEEATNPFNLETENRKEEKENTVKLSLKDLIINLLSKGYKYQEVLELTPWEINLILSGDYKKLEREAFHTNSIINTITGIMGAKEKIDILGRTEKTENLTEKYKTEVEALNILNSLK